jgi:hypothetical protein
MKKRDSRPETDERAEKKPEQGTDERRQLDETELEAVVGGYGSGGGRWFAGDGG